MLPLRKSKRDPPAKSIPDAEWAKNKDLIRRLYIGQDLKLSDVMDIMKKDYNFTPSLNQYKSQFRQWEFEKNKKPNWLPDDDRTGDGRRGGKRQCIRSDPQGAGNAGSTEEPTIVLSHPPQPVPAAVDLSLRPNPTYPDVIQPQFRLEQPAMLSRASGQVIEGQPVSMGLPRVQTGGLPSGTQTFPGGFESHNQVYMSPMGMGPEMNLSGYQGLDLSQELPCNLSLEHGALQPMNIMTGAGRQVSQPARPMANRRIASNRPSRQPIHQAAQAGNFEGVKLLLDLAPSSAHIVDNLSVTPLWLAAQGGYLDIVDLLLTHGVDVKVADNVICRTPIHQAAQRGHLKVVERLLEQGADADPRDESGVSPLWSAADGGHHQIVDLLIGRGADKEVSPNRYNLRSIHQAAQNGHVEVVRVLLRANAEANPEREGPDVKTPSPFWLAAQGGYVSLGKLLIDENANPEFALGSSKRQPIHQAAQNGHFDFVRLLIDHRVNVDAREKEGWTALAMAAQIGHLEIVDLLLKHGANVNASAKDNATALWIASQRGHIDIVKRLRKYEAKVIPVESTKRRPLHQAAQNGHFEVVKFLVNEFQEDINALDSEQATPLLLAAQGDEEIGTEIMKFLLENGAEPEISSGTL